MRYFLQRPHSDRQASMMPAVAILSRTPIARLGGRAATPNAIE